ncbi:unnamed protein product, partial [Timema podura]|nr:unnamed protein product [Timema podura]
YPTKSGVVTGDLTEYTTKPGAVTGGLTEYPTKPGVVTGDLTEYTTKSGVVTDGLTEYPTKPEIVTGGLTEYSTEPGVVKSGLTQTEGVPSVVNGNGSKSSYTTFEDITVVTEPFPIHSEINRYVTEQPPSLYTLDHSQETVAEVLLWRTNVQEITTSVPPSTVSPKETVEYNIPTDNILICSHDSDCPQHRSCSKQYCIDPCIEFTPCVRDVICTVKDHAPVCLCPTSGNRTMPTVDCSTHPVISCANHDACPAQLACFEGKCQNPCSVANPCKGQQDCQVHDHQPVCVKGREPVVATGCEHCRPGYTCNPTTGACIKGRTRVVTSADQRLGQTEVNGVLLFRVINIGRVVVCRTHVSPPSMCPT